MKAKLFFGCDDNKISVFEELFPLAKTHRIPFHCWLQGVKMEGEPSYISGPGQFMSNAMLEEMRDYRDPTTGERLVSFGSHCYDHTDNLADVDFETVAKPKIDNNEAFMTPYWSGYHKTFSGPFGGQNDEITQYLTSKGYVLCRSTSSNDSAPNFLMSEFIGATGLPHHPMELRIVGDLGTPSADTAAKTFTLIDNHMAPLGLMGELYSHLFVNTPVATDQYAISELEDLILGLRTRIDGGTLEMPSYPSLAARIAGPFSGSTRNFIALTRRTLNGPLPKRTFNKQARGALRSL